MARRRFKPPATRTCLTAGCGATIAGWKRLCDPCFRRLPFERRKAIAEAGQARAPHIVARLAIEGAKLLEKNTPAAVAARRQGERDL